jgi:hypothetical protein
LKFCGITHNFSFPTRTNHTTQSRCEAILRARPDNRLAAELHLAATESQEHQEGEQVKKAAAIGAVAVAAVGVLGVIASAMLTKHR